MTKTEFGKLRDGRTAYLYTICNKNGLEATITDFGGIVTKLLVPDKNGQPVDIVLGFDTLAEYEVNPPYLGAIIGRCGNRIAGGRFSLDGVDYTVDCNEGGKNHLHGGYVGFDKKLWNASQTSEDSLILTLLSEDGDQGYPGNLIVGVTYTLTADNALVITYRGMSDKKTLLNLTNHTYFNLAGQAADTIYDQWLRIESDAITEITDNLALTGRLFDVTGSPLDFRKPKRLGQDIASDQHQMALASGFDHNYVLKPGCTAAAYCEETGISMEVSTDLPGVQLYSGNFIQDTLTFKGGRKSQKHRGFCLETQYVPDAINHPEFTSPILNPGVPYVTETRFAFGTGKPAWMK